MTAAQISLVKDADLADATDEVDEVEVDDVAVESTDDEADAPSRSFRLPKLSRPKWFGHLRLTPALVRALVMAAVAAVALAAALYFLQFRPDQQTDAAAKQEVLNAATEGTVAILSYSPENLDQALTSAQSYLTGDFGSYYRDFAQQIVKPAAMEKEVTTSAAVVSAAVTEISPDSAVVLVFVNQQTMSNERQEPSLAASSVVIRLTKVDGVWKINEFTPV